MNPDSPFVELECSQIIKFGQHACGDDFQWLRLNNEDRYIAVLSDGLGSGIKANLLANMTTTMALKFISSNMDILKSAETIMDTLPVCEVRKISYATFTIIDMRSGGRTRVIEMGNPSYIQLRKSGENGETEEVAPLTHQKLVSKRWPDRDMDIWELQMEIGDRLIACSDGVTQAGLGQPGIKFGWRRQGCLEYVQELISVNPDISARDLSGSIAQQAKLVNRDHRCHDDISALVVFLRHPRLLRIITGPPFHKEDDFRFASLAVPSRENGADRVIVCGGTTANIINRLLNTRVHIDLKSIRAADTLPPPGQMERIGLTTEGILTLTRVASDLESGGWANSPAASRQIIEQIMESDCIEFVVGTKVNEAHQDPSLPVDLEIRRNIIKRLQKILEEKYRKAVEIQFF